MTDAEDRQGFGARLTEARKARGMSIEDVHQHTRLEMRIIEALELERIDDLGQPVYARGYIRSYARLVGLDPQSLIESYNATSGAPEVDSWAPLQVEHHEAGQHVRPRHVALALVVIVTLLVLFWVFGKEDDAAGQAPAAADSSTAEGVASGRLAALPEQPKAEAPAAEPPAPVEEQGRAEESAEEGGQATGAADEGLSPENASAEDAAQAQTPGAAESADNSLPQTVSGGKTLTLELDGDSWVEVIDARGRKLVRRLLQAGQVEQLVGEPPFSIFLGNADAVRIEYEGELIDPRRWRRPNATARFRIPE